MNQTNGLAQSAALETVKSVVVSEPGATLRIERIEMSAQVRESLTTRASRITGHNASPQDSASESQGTA